MAMMILTMIVMIRIQSTMMIKIENDNDCHSDGFMMLVIMIMMTTIAAMERGKMIMNMAMVVINTTVNQ